MALTKVDISMMLNTGTTANKLLVSDGSGNLPAVDGSQLTNLNTGITKSSSDPTISTNPSGGVGTEWHNTTSGEVYLCTDATTGENVWTNVGDGTGDIAPWDNYGYKSGGHYAAPWRSASVERYPFASDTNSTDWCDLVMTMDSFGACSSATDGYTMDGHTDGSPQPGTDIVSKFSFSSGATGTSVGNCSEGTSYHNYGGAACQDIPGGYGYHFGGHTTYGEHGGNQWEHETIERVSFSSGGNMTDHGNLKYAAYRGGGVNSSTYGYSFGGTNQNNTTFGISPWAAQSWGPDITKFAFSSNSLGTDVGDLTTGVTYTDGVHTASYGWRMGSQNPAASNIIDRWSFSADGNATDVADMSVAKSNLACAQSATHGYAAGGEISWPNFVTHLEKFNFSTQVNSTNVADVGDNNHYGHGMGGHES